MGFLVFLQSSAKTKEDAEKAFQETSKLDTEVDDMMVQLNAAEQELARKKAEADHDMMMATVVRHAPIPKTRLYCFSSPVSCLKATVYHHTGIRQCQGGGG